MQEEFPEIEYKVELRLNGKLIGDVRRIAEGLVWTKRRTKMGVDSISFTVNDFLFSEWCEERGTTLIEMLKPLALDCRIIRNGVPQVGGYLAAMPAYEPSGHSANLTLQFDGYLNFLANVYLVPQPTQTKPLNEMVHDWISEANRRADENGKAFGFTFSRFDELATVQQSFEDYKDIKSYITDRCDNTSGAGEFELYIAADRKVFLIRDSEFGGSYTEDYRLQYPAQINIPSAITLSASEVTGFASCVIGVGNGETSGNEEENTAIVSRQVNTEAVKEYGYAEKVLSESSVSVQATLDTNTATELAKSSSMIWQPEIQVSGRQIAPCPAKFSLDGWYPSIENTDGSEPLGRFKAAKYYISLGATIAIQNNEDMTGMTSGEFRVEELEVAVEATGAETIKPTLSRRGSAVNNSSFAQEFIRMQNEIRALKAKK